MNTYSVSFEIEIPDDIPLADVEAFLEFELGARGGIAGSNPLAHKDLSSFDVSNLWVS